MRRGRDEKDISNRGYMDDAEGIQVFANMYRIVVLNITHISVEAMASVVSGITSVKFHRNRVHIE